MCEGVAGLRPATPSPKHGLHCFCLVVVVVVVVVCVCVWGGGGGWRAPPLDLGPSDPGTRWEGRGRGGEGGTPHTLGIAGGGGGGRGGGEAAIWLARHKGRGSIEPWSTKGSEASLLFQFGERPRFSLVRFREGPCGC